MSKPDPEPDGNEGAAEGENDRAEGQKVHHGCVDPRATVHPQTQRHEHERQDSGRDGHDNAGKQKPSKAMYYALFFFFFLTFLQYFFYFLYIL